MNEEYNPVSRSQMIPQIHPIIKPDVSWLELLDNFKELTGKKLTESLDMSPIELREPARILVALYTIRAHPMDPLNVLRSCLPFVGPFLNYGFLTTANEETFKILQAYTQLNILHTHSDVHGFNVGVVSASLSTWHTTIIHCSLQMTDRETRQLFNKYQLWFENEGLSILFDNHSKVDLKDESFKLELKK
jgi:hypothetical protein